MKPLTKSAIHIETNCGSYTLLLAGANKKGKLKTFSEIER
jgi:hypothetical protein